MNKQEFHAVLHAIDQMIQISEPRMAEYYRGYRKGIQLFFLGTLEESIQEHYSLNESYAASGDPYVDSYARGYRDGCRGLKPAP